MQLGMIGLGRMGSGMTERLREGGHEVQTYDPNVETRTATSLAELKDQLQPPRAFWLMIPAGKITEDAFHELLGIVDRGDTIVDGGNSNFRDSKRRYEEAQRHGIHFIDAGVSGGVWGLKVGFCLMVGGDDEPVQRLEPIFQTLAPKDGYAHVGQSGAGHFVKMVHNGIEYGLMQSYAEGFEVMEHSEYDLDAQTRTQELLHRHGIATPSPIVYEADDSWIGSRFLVMPRIVGHTPSDTTYATRGWLHDAGPQVALVVTQLREAGKEAIHQRAALVAGGRVDDQSSRLVDDDHGRIFVDHFERHRLLRRQLQLTGKRGN